MILKGKSVFGGVAIGRISVFSKKEQKVTRKKIEDGAAEIKLFEDARETAKQLGKIYKDACASIGKDHARIFEVNQMMLDDEDYCDAVRNMFESQKINAEFSVASTGDTFSTMFAEMDNEYMKARFADIKDILNRVISILEGNSDSVSDTAGIEKVILLADDLAPSETVQLDRSKILAFVTRYGSVNSHTAILARTMNIPALICVDFDAETADGVTGIVDGNEGTLILDPDEETIEKHEKKHQEEMDDRRRFMELKGKPSETKSGRKIKVFANIGSVADVASVQEYDAEDIGLFRSDEWLEAVSDAEYGKLE